MTEPTYTEAEIREAIDRTNNIGDWTADKIFKELKRHKHDFAEGQVVRTRDDDYCVLEAYDMKWMSVSSHRHLNMTELGPHVKALRDALKHQAIYGCITKHADNALAEFDAAVGEEE